MPRQSLSLKKTIKRVFDIPKEYLHFPQPNALHTLRGSFGPSDGNTHLVQIPFAFTSCFYRQSHLFLLPPGVSPPGPYERIFSPVDGYAKELDEAAGRHAAW